MRLSGVDLAQAVRTVCGTVPAARRATLVQLRDDAGRFDEGLLTWMPGPRSYTGEDVAEVSCHGNPLIVQRLLDAFCAAGARLAGPGEFTRRAFLNGRMDLTRAEAILQAIAATSPAGLAVARAGMEGAVVSRAAALRTTVVNIAAELEAVLDYPGEDLLFSGDAALVARLDAVAADAGAIVVGHRAASVAVEGARVALIGPVNAGKSSLFNALLGRARALVSASPGTTRDVVESALQLDAVRLTLLDTAGERIPADPVEAAGQALARATADEADLLLLVLPGHLPLSPEGAALLDRSADRVRRIVVTHADLSAGIECSIPVDFRVSAVTGEGIAALRAALPLAVAGEAPGAVETLIASRRQRDLFAALAAHCAAAAEALRVEAGPAVAVERLYEALATLDGLTGRDTREAVLDRLFARFCVGK